MKADTTPCESLKFLESVERPVPKNPSTFSESFRFFDVPSTEPKLTAFSQKPEEKLHISRPPNHALAVLSSETRRLLREMERRNSPIMVKIRSITWQQSYSSTCCSCYDWPVFLVSGCKKNEIGLESRFAFEHLTF